MENETKYIVEIVKVDKDGKEIKFYKHYKTLTGAEKGNNANGTPTKYKLISTSIKHKKNAVK